MIHQKTMFDQMNHFLRCGLGLKRNTLKSKVHLQILLLHRGTQLLLLLQKILVPSS